MVADNEFMEKFGYIFDKIVICYRERMWIHGKHLVIKLWLMSLEVLNIIMWNNVKVTKKAKFKNGAGKAYIDPNHTISSIINLMFQEICRKEIAAIRTYYPISAIHKSCLHQLSRHTVCCIWNQVSACEDEVRMNLIVPYHP